MVLSLDRWVGRVAVVTGASSGIGAAICKKLVETGMIVAGLARRSDRVEGHARQLSHLKGKLHALKVDVSDEKDLLAAFEWIAQNLGPIHVLVNNAGLAIPSIGLLDGSTEEIRSIVDLNLMAVCIGTREAVKVMEKHHVDGHIVNMNSILGHYVPPLPYINVYPATKYAVTALTETLRHELNAKKSKIKITSISPRHVDTEMTLQRPDKLRSEYFNEIPLLDAEDIADAVAYVLSTPPHVQVHELTIRPVGEKC